MSDAYFRWANGVPSASVCPCDCTARGAADDGVSAGRAIAAGPARRTDRKPHRRADGIAQAERVLEDEVMAHVSFRKQCNDGAYGSETAEVTLDVGTEDVTDEAIEAMLATARRIVHDELRNSPSSNVRRALEYPKPIEERARESAELELAIGKRQAYADDDEDDDQPELPY